MAEMTKKQRVRAALAGEPLDRPPASMWGHDFTREWSASDLVEATLEQYRAYDWDFIKLNPRASYFAEAWGSEYGAPTDAIGKRTKGADQADEDDFVHQSHLRNNAAVLLLRNSQHYFQHIGLLKVQEDEQTDTYEQDI